MKTFLFQGDSITDCGRDRNDDRKLGMGYPTMVAGKLSLDYPAKLNFINRGVSGNRVVDMYARIKRDCINLKPDYLTVLIGVNDVWHELREDPNGIDNDKYFRLYCSFIEETMAACEGVKIFILEPFVLKASATEERWDSFNSEVRKRAESAKKVAEKYGLTFIPLQEKLSALCEEAPASFWLMDGVHPSYAGNMLIAEEVLSAVKKFI